MRFVHVLARVLAAELDREELRKAFVELDRKERDRAHAIALYREVLQELVLTRYALDRRDDKSTEHAPRARDAADTRSAVECLLPDEIEPGSLRDTDEA